MVFALFGKGQCLEWILVSRKYASDYRLENVEDKKGRIITKSIYRGDLYGFSKSEKGLGKLKKVYVVSTLMEWVLYFASLLMNTESGRTMYVSLPFLVIAFPLLGQSDAVWTFISSRKDVIRSVKDKITEKMISWVFMVFFFSLSSFVGHIIFWIRNGEGVKDAIFLVLTLLVLGLSWNLFLQRKGLSMEKSGTTVLPEREDE